jgi:hypothetical protein
MEIRPSRAVAGGTLTASKGSPTVAAGERTLEQLEAKFGRGTLAAVLREFDIAGSAADLTESEAQYLLRATPNADALRDRIAASRLPRTFGVGEGTLFRPGGAEEVDVESVDVAEILAPPPAVSAGFVRSTPGPAVVAHLTSRGIGIVDGLAEMFAEAPDAGIEKFIAARLAASPGRRPLRAGKREDWT